VRFRLGQLTFVLLQVDRVTSVLDSVLAKQKYLVGDKASVADLIFIPWNQTATRLLEGSEIDLGKYTHYQRWHQALLSRPAVKKCIAEREGYAAEERAAAAK